MEDLPLQYSFAYQPRTSAGEGGVGADAPPSEQQIRGKALAQTLTLTLALTLALTLTLTLSRARRRRSAARSAAGYARCRRTRRPTSRTISHSSSGRRESQGWG